MKKNFRVLLFTIATCLLGGAAHADSPSANGSMNDPWEKFSVSLGAFLSDTQSSVRVGGGLGVDVDVEKALGLESKTAVLRADSLWRFSHNRRHRLDASWFALRRSADRKIGEDFDIKDRNGNIVTVQAGSEVKSHFNLDIIETSYSYSFVQDDRVDLAVGGGFYVMPIRFGLDASGVTDTSGSLNFTAPLPVVGLRMDVALNPKWYVRTGSQLFYIQYQGFTGRLTQTRAAIEYLPVKHVGLGIGVDNMRFAFEGTGKDYPNVDLSGNVNFEYTGLQLYGKFLF